MDSEARKLINVSGQENHGGVHLCHKCGWPFPNPHPSAKQRRSHKKICGTSTIEGYKSIDSEENPHLTVSDDDLETPSPKIVKKTNSEVGSGSVGEISNRSEYEVFADAVAEFSDAGRNPGMEEHFEETRESVPDMEKVAENEAITTFLDKESVATESTAVPEDVTVCPSRLMETKRDVEGDEKDLQENWLVSPSESARETSEGGCKLEEMNGNSSDVLITDGIVVLKEEKSDSSSHIMPQSDISPDDVNIDTLGDSTKIQVNTARALDFESGDTIEGCDSKGEGNSSEHYILVPDNIPVVNHPDIMIEGFKGHNPLKYNQHITFATYEGSRDEEDNDKDLVSEVHSNSESRQLAESVGVSFRGVHALTGESSELMVEGVPIERETDIHDIKDNTDEKLLSDNLGSPADKARADMRKSQTVSSLEEQASQDSCVALSNKILPEPDTTVLSFPDLLVSSIEADDNQTVNLVHGGDACNHEKAMTETCDIEDNGCREGAMKERETNPGSGNDSCDSQNKRISNLIKGDNAGAHDKVEIKITGTTGSHLESQVAEDDGMDDSVICIDTVSTPLDQVSDSSRVGMDEKSHLVEIHSNLQKCQDEDSNESAEEPEINSNKNVELLKKTLENQMMKDPLLSPVESASVIPEDEHATVLGRRVSESLQEQGDKSFSKQQPSVSAADVSFDSLSQTDSLEGNWGSVSVLSTLSDAPAVVDAEALPSTVSQASAIAKKANMKEGHQSDNPNIIEPPSFNTLVEPRGGADRKIDASETPTVQNSQQSNSASYQAGWFPSLTHVVNDSRGRKKNEEIIARVKNWTDGKQHTPLKSLLGEANAEAKQKSSNPTSMAQKDGIAAKNNGNSVTTANAILDPDPHVAQAAKAETGQEWDSPARYPAEIKRERRKAKGKPYWVPFVCCSSIN